MTDYEQIVKILKQKANIHYGNNINIGRLKLNARECLIWDLDIGSIISHQTNEISKKTNSYWYYLANGEKHPDRTESEINKLKQILTELEK